MKRIVVTGAAGFVGRHVLAALASADESYQIVGIGRGLPGILPKGVLFRKIDLLDRSAVCACIDEVKPTDVLHLAAMASVQQSATAPIDTWRANVVGLINLAEALSLYAGGANVFFVSSGEVYGRAFLAGHALDETVVPQPLSTYARSKLFGEGILHDVLRSSGQRLVILRPFNHIGSGQDERFVVPSFAGQIARIEAGLAPPVLETGNLDAQRDFLAVGDVVRAYVRVVERAEDIESGTIFNVASGTPRTISSVLAGLTALARVRFAVRIAADRMRPSEIPLAAGDATRLRDRVGWHPKEDWTAALAAVLDEARLKVQQPSS